MRLFFAVELPPEVRAALGRLRPPEALAGAGDYRWVDPALLHITLVFLGEQPGEALQRLGQAARDTATAWPGGRFTLAVQTFGAFGPRRAPRVLWAGLGGDLATLASLQAALAARLRDGGFRLEDRPFSPHITLARRRQGQSSPAPLPWPPAGPGPALAVPVAGFTLFESQLRPEGPRYTALAEFAFG